MIWPVRRGVVFWIPDRAVELPPTPAAQRKTHEQRPYLILSNDTANADGDWELVFGVPLTTSEKFHSEWDIELKRGTANLPKACWTMVTLAQAVPKKRLRDGVGKLDPVVLDQIDLGVVRYLGLA